MRNGFQVSAAILCLVAFTGCGGSKLSPVSGKVTLDGKPLVGAVVMFMPASSDKNPGPASVGKTDAQGVFTLIPANGDGVGAVIGKHTVTITAYEGDGEQSSDPTAKSPFQKPIVPEEYNAKTTLSFDVPSGGSTSANFELKSAKK